MVARERLELIDKSKLKSWINSCKNEIVKGSKLIKSIICGWSKTLLVEVHTEGVYPSAAALKEQDSFINHIIRHIKTQLSEQQLQPNSPNIIVIQGYSWIILGFGDVLQDTKSLYIRR